MSEFVAPTPARFWWLKRLTASGLLLFAVLLGLRLWWGNFAQRQLDEEIAAARARGEPAIIDDFSEPDADRPPDAQNAAVQFAAAAASINYNAAQISFDNRFNTDRAMTDADRKLLHGLVLANATAIALTRTAADLPQVDWNLKLQSPIINTLLPALNWQRGLANLLRYAAVDHHLHDNDAQTVEDLRDIFRESDAAENYGPFLVTHLVAIGISALGADSVTHVAAALKIGPGGASQAQVRSLIGQILDEREYTAGGERCFYGERLIGTDGGGTLSYIVAPSKQRFLWPVQPMLTMDQARIFRFDTIIAHALREPTFPAASAKFPAFPNNSPVSPLHAASHLYITMASPSFGRLALTHYRGLTDRRTAAVILAIRLYELDHGAPPANLNLLVPTYLPAVPIDPFAPDGHVLRYVATPGAEVVYSVGEDGRDDGGSIKLLRPVNGRIPGPWEMRDAVFPYRPDPLLPPATNPINGN
jgi:hypothetical protein